MKHDERTRQTKSDLTNLENRVSNVTPPRLLTPTDVAARLNVSERTALQLIHELPHINVSRDLYSTRKRVRVTEQVLEDYVCGKIERKRLRRGR